MGIGGGSGVSSMYTPIILEKIITFMSRIKNIMSPEI